MKFIVDESTGGAVVNLLRAKGHDVCFVGEKMPQSDDHAILARAVKEERILITNDKDFGELVFRSNKSHHGVILLRLRNENPSNRIRTIRALLERYTNRLKGNFSVVTETQVRIRPL